MSKLFKENEILVSKRLDKSVPLLIVDFDSFNLASPSDKNDALRILNNLNGVVSIYTTSKDNNPITQLQYHKKLHDWSVGGGESFLLDLGNAEVKSKIQICGIYRELCIVEVASIIKKSALDIEPIIIDNDDYSISAEYSVKFGDTLENRLLEHGLNIKLVTN